MGLEKIEEGVRSSNKSIVRRVKHRYIEETPSFV